MGPHPFRHPVSADASAARPGAVEGARQLDVQRLPDHRDILFRAACALSRSREDAEDLVQETFERVLRRPRFLRRDSDLGYLLKVLRNRWMDSYHERSRRPMTVEFDEALDFVVDPGSDPTTSVADLRTIYTAIGELSPPMRETLVAVDIVGLSYREAASALGVRPGTIMSRLSRARGQVADRLEEAGIRPQAARADR
jgi:RNA polymerase sigma-70 factor (ECF subfamily)